MDLCHDKKFIDLTDDITFFNDKKGSIAGIIDSEKNTWFVEEGKFAEGGYGFVLFFKSHNKEYTDLALKILKDREEAADEVLTMTLFNKYRCKNFIRGGGLEDGNSFVILMEKIDGDLEDFDYKKVEDSDIFFRDFIKFLIFGYRCAMKRDMYYTDIKLENIGVKSCKNGYKFCFLDYGSFNYIDSSVFIATYWINLKALEKDYFSIDTIVIFGTIMTILCIKLRLTNYSGFKKFSDKISDLLEEKQYPETKLLTEEYYKILSEEYYKYYKKEDDFIETIMDCLERLTKEEYSVSSFVDSIDYYI